jgi:hypothetical protein
MANSSDRGIALTLLLTPRETLLVDALAERVVKLLRAEQTHDGLVDATTAARALGISRDCVYRHAAELGGRRIGDGPRGRLRFDLDRALAAWTARSTSKESHARQTPVAAAESQRRSRRPLGSNAELLPIRGSVSGSDARQERS